MTAAHALADSESSARQRPAGWVSEGGAIQAQDAAYLSATKIYAGGGQSIEYQVPADLQLHGLQARQVTSRQANRRRSCLMQVDGFFEGAVL